MPKLFISYGRDDTNEAAQRFFADLQVSFSGEVFLDEGGGLRPGERLPTKLAPLAGIHAHRMATATAISRAAPMLFSNSRTLG